MYLKELFADDVIEHGKDLYYRYGLELMKINGYVIESKVHDINDDLLWYDVEIEFEDNKRLKVSSLSCSCPAGKNGEHCVHEAAVLFAYDNAQRDMGKSAVSSEKKETPEVLDIQKYEDMIKKRIKKHGSYISEIRPFFADMLDILQNEIEPLAEKYPLGSYELCRFLFYMINEAKMYETYGRFEAFVDRLIKSMSKIIKSADSETCENIFKDLQSRLAMNAVEETDEIFNKVFFGEFKDEEHLRKKFDIIDDMAYKRINAYGEDSDIRWELEQCSELVDELKYTEDEVVSFFERYSKCCSAPSVVSEYFLKHRDPETAVKILKRWAEKDANNYLLNNACDSELRYIYDKTGYGEKDQ